MTAHRYLPSALMSASNLQLPVREVGVQYHQHTHTHTHTHQPATAVTLEMLSDSAWFARYLETGYRAGSIPSDTPDQVKRISCQVPLGLEGVNTGTLPFREKKYTHFEKRSKLNHCPLFLLLSRVSCLIIDVRFLTFGINNEELISWILVLVVLRIVNSVWRCLISK